MSVIPGKFRSVCVALLIGGWVLAGLWAVGGCRTSRKVQVRVAPANTTLLMPLNLDRPAQPTASPGAINLAAARNEIVGFSLQITGLPAMGGPGPRKLRLVTPSGDRQTLGRASAWQILPMPVELNRAGYVRHTGQTIRSTTIPQALLPLQSPDDVIDLSQLRDPARPTLAVRAGGSGAESAQLWIDLHVAKTLSAGQHPLRCELLGIDDEPLAAVDVNLSVYDFALPDERHLHMISPLDWDRLVALLPEQFETIRPNLLSRSEPAYAPAIRTLDQLVALAQAHRCQVTVPRLAPRVKWPPGQPPDVEWNDFIALVHPWLSGEAFADKVPLGFWPIPQPDLLPRFDRASQLEYWTNAAGRFDQADWLPQSALLVDPLRPGRASAADAVELSALAARLLAVHTKLRVAVPLEDDQLLLANDDRPNMIDPRSAGRLLCSAQGLVYAPPIQPWPAGVPRPRRWLRTDLPGLVPYLAGQHDVQMYGWLAYLREADLILWPGSLPRTDSPADYADPNDLVWFYPGQWFGIDEPLPTLQLKWLRRAQQDYEYLWLARSRGEKTPPLLMARAITKPVQLLSTEAPDPVYALMSGTADPDAWPDVKALLARYILFRQGDDTGDRAREQLNVDLLRWLEPQDRQFHLARTTTFLLDQAAGNELTLRLGLDLYNASDDTPGQNSIAWSTMPHPWTFRPQAMSLPSLSMFQITRPVLEARMNLDHLGTAAAGTTPTPIEWIFTNGFTRRAYPMQAVVPVAPVDRRTMPLSLDGDLKEWDAADTIQHGPLVKMLDRPTLQKQQIAHPNDETRLYAAWTDENLYVAFRLAGVTQRAHHAAQNFVSYDARRAWREDLCSLLIQPQYADNSLGPVLHITCKTTGGVWVEKKFDPRTHADPWAVIEGSAIRYAPTVSDVDGLWRGEVAIPWKAILDEGRERPALLRFNVVHHVGDTGESASWAGPIDYGRDDSFMGALYIRDLDAIPWHRPRQAASGKR